jgi:acetylglutamate kinase
MTEPILIKVGGHEVNDATFLAQFAATIHDWRRPVVIVHGGGKEISSLQEKLGIVPRYLDGIRITDEASLSVVQMVLCGAVNKRLVRYLTAQGVDAMGLSGVDRGVVRATKMAHATMDMQYTGVVSGVRGDVIQGWLAQGITPVIAPICQGEDTDYNVNADHVAAAVASAIQVRRAVFLTNVPGVMREGQVLQRLTRLDVRRLVAEGTITGGMIPKVNMALHVLDAGVPEVVITNLAGLQADGGTVFVQSSG